jgi:hypothetical protein
MVYAEIVRFWPADGDNLLLLQEFEGVGYERLIKFAKF